MVSGGTVVVDADELLKWLDKVRGAVEGLSFFLSTGMTTRPPSPERQRELEKDSKGQPAMVVDLDISGIEWQTRYKQPAGPDAPWCWAFGYNNDGTVRRETNQLVQGVLQYGVVKIGQYEVSLGGRDGNLLNRRRIKN